MGEGIFGLGLIMRAVVQGEPMGHPSPGRPFLRCTGAGRAQLGGSVSPWAQDCPSSTLGFQAVLRTLDVSGPINSVVGSDREKAQGGWKSSHLAWFSAHS